MDAQGRPLPVPDLVWAHWARLPLHERRGDFPCDARRRVTFKRQRRLLSYRAGYRGLAAVYAWALESEEIRGIGIDEIIRMRVAQAEYNRRLG